MRGLRGRTSTSRRAFWVLNLPAFEGDNPGLSATCGGPHSWLLLCVCEYRFFFFNKTYQVQVWPYTRCYLLCSHSLAKWVGNILTLILPMRKLGVTEEKWLARSHPARKQ